MTRDVYIYLAGLLRRGPLRYPEPRIFQSSADFGAEHLQCHLTTAQVAVECGLVPVVGIRFLDLVGKLYPWPHMVNREGGLLVDCSPPVEEPSLGFIETGWHEWEEWRDVTIAYNEMEATARAPRWGSHFPDALTDEFLPRLRRGAGAS